MEREREDDPYEAIEYGDFGTYFRHKKQKLQLQQDEIAALAPPDLAQIFEGIVVYVNGYTDPPIHEIRNMIVQRGGEFRQYLSKSSITHIIASNLTQAKMKEFRNYKVARPDWIVESVKANKLLPWHNFNTLRIPGSLHRLESQSLTSLSFTRSPSIPQEPPSVAQAASLAGSASNDTYSASEIDASRDPTTETHQPSPDPLDDGEFFTEDLDLDQLELQLTPPNTINNTGVASYVKEPLSDTPLSGHENSNVLPTESADLANTDRASSFRSPDTPPPIAPTNGTVSIDSSPGIPHGAIAADVLDTRHPTLIELSVPWNRLNSSVLPGFVEKFYQSSRLHYLSTWKAKLREITAEIQKDKPRLSSISKDRVIMHIDFDCFFASVATRGKPELQNRPIAVAHGSGGSTSNSEIASCNYLARGFGVKNGMQLLKARSLCPDLLVVPYEFREYEDISIEFYKILLSYADELQAVSIDEALVDVTSRCRSTWGQTENTHGGPWNENDDNDMTQTDPGKLAERVREEIFQATGCHASVGIAPNILLAKLSTKRAKPHGQYIWPSAPGTEQTLRELRGPVSLLSSLDVESTPSSDSDKDSQSRTQDAQVEERQRAPKEFSVKDLPGVGYKTMQDLQDRFSVHTLYELQQVSKEELQRICGMKTGEMLFKSCRGIDDSTLASDREKARQSVSAEISWGVRFENQEQVNIFLQDLSKEVSKRLKEIDRKAKSIVMKVMKRKEYVHGHWKHLGHGPVDQFARTGQLPMYTDDPEIIAKEACNLLQYFKFDVLDLRGLGIQMLKLNNDVVNTLPRSTFTAPDSVNQTTLNPAMFQYKGPAAAAAASSSPKTLSSSRQGISYTTKESGPSDDVRIDTTPMEIDRNTFSELPLEIQEELSRHHHLVFVDRDPTGTSNSNINAQGSGYEGDGQYNDVTLAQHALPLRSQLDPLEPAALSTLEMTDTSKEYPETGQGDHGYASKAQADWLPMQPGSILFSPSKLDRSVFQALPPEIQAEIEQEYTHMMENKGLIQKLSLPELNSAVTSGGQPVSLGPQGSNRAPRKGQIQELSSGQGQTGESGREKDVASVNAAGHSRATAQDETDEGHKESPGTEDLQEGIEPLRSSGPDICTTADIPELDADFLAALPPDIRAEIETAHNLEMIKHRQKHATAANIRQVAAGYEVGCTTIPDRLVLERPTLMGLRDVGELRKMLTEWVRSTLLEQDTPTAENDTDDDRGGSGTATRLIVYDEGPNPEDVKSFSDFIARVIFMERDLERVRVLLRYLQRRIEENEKSASPEHPAPKHVRVMVSWREALESITSTARQQILELYGGTLVLD